MSRPEPLRVLFLTIGPDAEPSSRFRVHQLLPGLAEAGIQASVRPLAGHRYFEMGYGLRTVPGPLRAVWVGAHFAGRALRRVRDLVAARRFDVVFVQKEVFPFGLERLIPRLGLRVVYDFDDAVYLRPALPDGRGAGLRRLADGVIRRERALPALLERCAAVVAGSEVLARYGRRHNPRVAVVPTVVDTDAYAAAPRRNPARPVLGWFGAPPNVVHLRSLVPVLQRLAERRAFSLRVHGVERFECPGVEVQCVPWKRYASVHEEVADLHGFDVGLMPLPDDAWAAGKCALKAIQYMACGIPVVASPVGAARQVVAHGEVGFLARDETEWAGHLDRLLADPGLRADLGDAGRRRAARLYSTRRAVPELARLLRSAAAG